MNMVNRGRSPNISIKFNDVKRDQNRIRGRENVLNAVNEIDRIFYGVFWTKISITLEPTVEKGA